MMQIPRFVSHKLNELTKSISIHIFIFHREDHSHYFFNVCLSKALGFILSKSPYKLNFRMMNKVSVQYSSTLICVDPYDSSIYMSDINRKSYSTVCTPGKRSLRTITRKCYVAVAKRRFVFYYDERGNSYRDRMPSEMSILSHSKEQL